MRASSGQVAISTWAMTRPSLLRVGFLSTMERLGRSGPSGHATRTARETRYLFPLSGISPSERRFPIIATDRGLCFYNSGDGEIRDIELDRSPPVAGRTAVPDTPVFKIFYDRSSKQSMADRR
jgi:hypothetical protein